MVEIFAAISLISCIMILALGEYVYLQNRSGELNKLFSYFCIILGLWAFNEFMIRSADSFSTAHFWLRFNGLFWPFATAFFLHFALRLTGRLDLLGRRATYIALYGPAILMAVFAATTDLITGVPIMTAWGWAFSVPPQPVPFILTSLWIVGQAFTAIGLLIYHYFQTTIPRKKKQTLYIAIGFVAVAIAGVVTEIVFPYFRIEVPEQLTTSFVILVAMVGYAIMRYELFSVNPVTAIGDIFHTMRDALFLCARSGQIVSVNKAALELLEYDEDRLVGGPADILFENKEEAEELIVRALDRGISTTAYETYLRSRDQRALPVLVSLTVIKDKAGEPAGMLGIATDITRRKDAEAALSQANVELEARVEERTAELATLYSAQRHIAETLQEALVGVPASVPGISYSFVYHSATDMALVGGDICELFPLRSGLVAIAVGDISGKGLEAATLSMHVKYALKAYLYQDESPASVMSKLNEMVERNTPFGRFATMFVGVMDTETGELVYCNAGHPGPVVRDKDQYLRILEVNSPAVGISQSLNFNDSRIRIRQGDVVTLYSDGATEIRGSEGLFGEERLIGFLSSFGSDQVEELPGMVMSELKSYGGIPKDDVVVLSFSLQKPIVVEPSGDLEQAS